MTTMSIASQKMLAHRAIRGPFVKSGQRQAVAYTLAISSFSRFFFTRHNKSSAITRTRRTPTRAHTLVNAPFASTHNGGPVDLHCPLTVKVSPVGWRRRRTVTRGKGSKGTEGNGVWHTRLGPNVTLGPDGWLCSCEFMCDYTVTVAANDFTTMPQDSRRAPLWTVAITWPGKRIGQSFHRLRRRCYYSPRHVSSARVFRVLKKIVTWH